MTPIFSDLKSWPPAVLQSLELQRCIESHLKSQISAQITPILHGTCIVVLSLKYVVIQITRIQILAYIQFWNSNLEQAIFIMYTVLVTVAWTAFWTKTGSLYMAKGIRNFHFWTTLSNYSKSLGSIVWVSMKWQQSPKLDSKNVWIYYITKDRTVFGTCSKGFIEPVFEPMDFKCFLVFDIFLTMSKFVALFSVFSLVMFNLISITGNKTFHFDSIKN